MFLELPLYEKVHLYLHICMYFVVLISEGHDRSSLGCKNAAGEMCPDFASKQSISKHV